jgi:hypothetical protein
MLSSHAAPRLTARAEHIRARVERQLRRYPAAVQTAVRAAARLHPHVADLAVSFPALLFAVAATRQSADRARLIAAIVEGEPLAHVAALARVPLWLRRLPPETFTRPIPPLPDGALFRRQIANHLPASVKLAPAWLDAVSHAALWGHEGLAIWFARELTRDPKRARKLHCLNTIALWAWYSAHVPADAGLVSRPWHPAMHSGGRIGWPRDAFRRGCRYGRRGAPSRRCSSLKGRAGPIHIISLTRRRSPRRSRDRRGKPST